MTGKKIVLIGPAHPIRGGLAAFNERLASAAWSAGLRRCAIAAVERRQKRKTVIRFIR